MKHLLWVLGLIALGAAAWYSYQCLYTKPVETSHVILAIISWVVALICWGVFFFIRVRQGGEEEMSITKF